MDRERKGIDMGQEVKLIPLSWKICTVGMEVVLGSALDNQDSECI